MSTWTAKRVAWAIGGFSLVLMVATLVLMFVDRGADLPDNVGSWGPDDVFDVVVTLGVPILGIIVVTKQPKNAIVWLFLGAGVALGLGTFGQTYALHALVAEPGSIPAGRALGWMSKVVWPIPIAALILLFLLFPTGHPVTPRWRIVGWITVAMLVVLLTASVIVATASWSHPFRDFLDIESGAWVDAARVAAVIAVLAEVVALFLSVVSIVIRYRRSTGAERLQLKWFVSAAAVTAVVFSVGFFNDSPVIAVLVSVALLGLLVAIGIAMV